MLSFAANQAVLWTIGHYIAKTYGCATLSGVAGVSMAAASLFGTVYVYNHHEKVIAGGSAISTGLITYSVLRNPSFFKFMRVNP